MLDGEQVTIGRNPANDVALPDDRMVSWHHAVLRSLRSGWCAQDLGSRNGTVIRGERLTATRALRHGDDIVVGRTRIVFVDPAGLDVDGTHGQQPLPRLTDRERDVLRELCRPLLGGGIVREPAKPQAIAVALTVGVDAVQQHLGHLYEKFKIPAGERSRRAVLAEEAVLRGAVSAADVTGPTA